MSDCTRFPKLLRLRDAGETEAIEAHLAECPACAEAWRDLAALSALGQALPDGRPSEARRESVRTRILAQASAPPRRHPGRLVALAAAAAIGAWIIGTQFTAQAPPTIGRIASAPGAVFSVRKTEDVEWVALEEGRITIRVPTLPDERRLVVVTDDAEVEVRGTIFTVEAVGGRLQAVEVEEGVVEVRPAGAEAVRLQPSERWATPPRAPDGSDEPRELPATGPETASKPRELPIEQPARMPPGATPRPAEPTSVAEAAGQGVGPDRAPTGRQRSPRGMPEGGSTAPSGPRGGPGTAETPADGRADDPPSPPSAVDGPPAEGATEPADRGEEPPAEERADAAPADAGPSPQTARFDAGWRALRAGRPEEAAPAFAEAAALGGPLTADARWWRAVALGRAGDDAAARDAVRAFLDLHPRSSRRFEASVMLGWLDFAAGRVDAAEAAFTRGLDAGRPAVRARAREGLDAVKAWRAERAQ